MLLTFAISSEDIQNFAWIVPIISKTKPIVTAGDIQVIKDTVKYFDDAKDAPDGDETVSSGKGGGGAGVEVIETKEIGIYDITILKAENSGVLTEWLKKNGYKIPENAQPVLDSYIKKGNCYFVANKIDLKNKYRKAIAFEKKRYMDDLKKYDALIADINKAFGRIGITKKIANVHIFWANNKKLIIFLTKFSGV
jgi:hypothetical protein